MIRGSSLDKFNKEFVKRIKKLDAELPVDEELFICDSGLILKISKENKVEPLGCPTCFGEETKQDKDGYPTVKNIKLVSAYDKKDIPSNLNSLIKANLWFCPNCGLPITKLIPNFV